MTHEQKEDNFKMMTRSMFESSHLARIGYKEKLLKFLTKVQWNIDHIHSRLTTQDRSDCESTLDHPSDWIAIPDIPHSDKTPVSYPLPEQPLPLRHSSRASYPPDRYGYAQTT